MPQLFHGDLGQIIGREIDREMALEGLELIDQRGAIPGFQNADEFFDLVGCQHCCLYFRLWTCRRWINTICCRVDHTNKSSNMPF